MKGWDDTNDQVANAWVYKVVQVPVHFCPSVGGLRGTLPVENSITHFDGYVDESSDKQTKEWFTPHFDPFRISWFRTTAFSTKVFWIAYVQSLMLLGAFWKHKDGLCRRTQTQNVVLKTCFITQSFVFSNTNSLSLLSVGKLRSKHKAHHKHKHKHKQI